MSREKREGLRAALAEGMREQASRAVLLHGLIAERAGLGPSDIKALDLARHADDLTAGRLAQLTGLSNSATTAMLDRLERRGYIERRADPEDRRKVVVVLTGGLDEAVGDVFRSMVRIVDEVLDDYDDDDLELLTGFITRLNAAMDRFARGLPGPGGEADRP